MVLLIGFCDQLQSNIKKQELYMLMATGKNLWYDIIIKKTKRVLLGLIILKNIL